MTSDKKTYTVTFIPDNRTGSVGQGSTIMDAALEAGVYLSSVCGGKGTCGKCRAIVREGQTDMEPSSFLGEDELRKGTVIACKTEVLSDLVVEVPEESRLVGKPKFESVHVQRFGETADGKIAYAHDPLCEKTFFDLPRPSIADNLSDLERLELEISKIQPLPVHTSLKTLRTLGPLLRESDFNITVTLADRETSVELVRLEAGDTTDSNFGIAIDIGTTTVIANMIDLNTGIICATAAEYNSQIKYGEDVISRIVYSQEHDDGLKKLNDAIIGDINNLSAKLISQCGISTEDVNYIVCTGNTIMSHIILSLELSSIRREPYISVAGKPPILRVSNVGIQIGEDGIINCLPGPGAYVGSDITAGVLASGMAREMPLSLLIDIGTNGEIVLGNSDLLICCSASAGPAFEGAGTRCGMRATSGAIEKARIDKKGNVYLTTIGGKKAIPRGICGSGFIDLVAELLMAGIIDRTGRFLENKDDDRLREGDDGPEFVLFAKGERRAERDIVITEADIATFIRTKGSLFTAAEALLYHVGYTWPDVDRVFISGGFGNYIDVQRAVTIGLLPDLPIEKLHFIGNGSITGAQMCLLSREAYQEAVRISGNMTYFDLSTDPWFMNEYTSSLFLPHTDLEKFPSVVLPEEV